MMPIRLLAAAIVFTLGLAACEPSGIVKTARPEGPVLSVDQPGGRASSIRTIDDEFVALVDEVPGFGGLFYDVTGTLTVNLKDPGTLGAARSRIGAFMTRQVRGRATQSRAAEIAGDVGMMKARRAKYDFRELVGYYRSQIVPLVSEVAGITMTDIDDAENRILIGVESVTIIGSVRERVTRLGMPPDLVEIVQFDPPVPQLRHSSNGLVVTTALLSQDLGSNLRPAVPGGARIGGDGWSGTLGFNLVPSTGTDRYFVTCSHCALPVFQMLSAGLGQPTYSGVLGIEVVDPILFSSSPCPSGKLCRWSEAALIRYHETQTSYADQGQVAYPTSQGTTTFTTRVTVTDVEWPYVGQPVHKVGAWGGRTTGSVNHTCFDTQWAGQAQWKMLCQGRATFASDSGDSGSPVLAVHANGTASAVGVFWGRSNQDAVFSILGAALDELYVANTSLGTMDPTGTPPPPPPALSVSLSGPSSVRPGWTCLWTATGSGGVPPYFYAWSVNGVGVNNGSSNPAELIYQNNGSSFTVHVSLSDSNPFGSPVTKQKSVTVSAGAPTCGF